MDSDSNEYSDVRDAGDDEDETNPKVKLLPTIPEGLRKRFGKLFFEFMRQQKHEHRNELVFLIDELLRQEAITRDEYKLLNNFLSESLDSGESDSEPDDEMEMKMTRLKYQSPKKKILNI